MSIARTQGSSLPIGPEQRHEQLTRAAQRWVSQTFYGTLLKQMRESPFKSELFSGGRGGEAFSMMLDQHLTERIARASDHNLVDSIVRSIERKGQPSGASPQSVGSVIGTRDAAALSQKASSHVAPTR